VSAEAWRGVGEGVFLFVLCHFLARVEIHIEGDHGWAVKLPTWRWGPEWYLGLTNGKELTGYHVWLTLFLIGVFHMPLVLAGFSRELWAKCAASYMLLATAWDMQWFVWNPAWGFHALRTREVTWFRKKLLGLPVDYYMAYAASAGLTWLIWSPGLPLWAWRTGTVFVLSALSIPAATLRPSR
jgi:hypothetical protein